jgi:transposase
VTLVHENLLRFSKVSHIDLAHFRNIITLARMTELELLKQENARLQADALQNAATLQQNANALRHHDAVFEQQAALLAEQWATIRKQEAKLEAQQLEINRLLQQAFGRRSERYLESPQQLKIDFGDSPEVTDATDGLQQAVDETNNDDADDTVDVPGHQRKKSSRKDRLPDNLPRIEVIADVPDDDKVCDTHGEKILIGYDTTETLKYTPPKLEVIATKIPKYACANQPQCGITQLPRPNSLIEGNRYDTSIAAEIITAKYGYHLPFYRQQDLFAGSGWVPTRSTLLNIMTAAATLVRPLVEFFADEVRKDGVIGTDDTGVTLLLPKTVPKVDPNDVRSRRVHEVLSAAIAEDKKHVKAKMWAYRAGSVPLNVFDFTVSRHRDGPDQFLIDNKYNGILLGDCYTGYTGINLRTDNNIQHAACNSHARRKIFEARHNHPQIASVLLAMFQELYDLEDQARPMDAANRFQLREEKSTLVWQRMREYLDGDVVSRLLPKEEMTQAVGYLNNHWDALQLYISHADVPIDNNETEQLMKQVAIGRKNWLFIGSLTAGARAADLMTLVSSALRNDLHVWAYVKGVLDTLLSGSTDYTCLRPDIWAQQHPEQIRTYRVKERRDKADRQQRRRASRRSAQS